MKANFSYSTEIIRNTAISLLVCLLLYVCVQMEENEENSFENIEKV